MIMRLLKYDIEVTYQPGKTMYVADMLSRASLPFDKNDQRDFEHINMAKFLPITEERLSHLRKETDADESLQMLKAVIQQGWPEKRDDLPGQLHPYFSIRCEMSVQDGLVFKGERVVVPRSLRSDMKQRIHSSHVGTQACLRRAQESLYWPGMASELKEYIATCETCRRYETSQQKETFMGQEVPARPWERIGTDLFTWDSKDFLITVDYYSNFWELDQLPDTRSKTVIRMLKYHFARHGCPDQVVSDNGPQYSSQEFGDFANTWGFEHTTISPGHSQANGQAESAVKSAKRLLCKAKDSGSDTFMAILDVRNTPTQGIGRSPAQQLLNRRTKTQLPTAASLLRPRTVNQEEELARLHDRLTKQATQCNKSARDLPPLEEGDVVGMQPFIKGRKEWRKAVVTQRLDERSYEVDTGNGTYRRNRVHLRKSGEFGHTPDDIVPDTSDEQVIHQPVPAIPITHAITKPTEAAPGPMSQPQPTGLPGSETPTPQLSRFGRAIRKPKLYGDYVTS